MPIEKIKPYLWVFPLCLAIAACVITFDLFFKLPIYRWTRGLGARDLLSSAVMNRSIVTITLSLFAGMFFLSYWEGGKKWKFILSGFLIFSVLPLLILTQSQSAQLSVLVGLFFFLFFPYKFKTAYTGLIGILTLTMVLAPWIAYWMWESLTFNSVFHEWFKNAYASNRMEIWDFVSRRALESPFYGHGLEATKLIGNFDHIPIFQKSSSILHPHNYALQLWIEFGLLGVVSCLFFLGYLFSFIQQRTTLLSGRVCMATLMAVLAVSAVGYGMWQSWWLGLLIYLLSLCALIVRFEQKTAKNSTYAP